MSDLEEWAFYLRYSNIPKYKPAIETLKQEKEIFRMAYETQEFVSQDLSERAYYMSRLKYELDIESGIYTAREQGLEQGMKQGMQQGMKQGMQQGIEQGITQTARNMLSLNAPIDFIIKATGLTETEVQRLAE
jgi:flagellar biosynthesis/type III secretory pathway protein FliH